MASLSIIHVSDQPQPTVTIELGRKDPPTLKDVIAKRGIADPKIRSVAACNAAQSRRAAPLAIPDQRLLNHHVLFVAQSPLFTINEDRDFSSRALTDWYVAEFERLNHLGRIA